MASPNPTQFNIETLNALGARLRDHAEEVADVVNFEPATTDLRLAAAACSRFASLKFRIAEIAEMALTQDGAATTRDLRQALDDAQG